MNKLIIISFIFLLLLSCQERKAKPLPTETPLEVVDTLLVVEEDTTLEQDSLALAIKAEDILMVKSDELFDDFIFNYASNKNIQRRRTVFPLPYYHNNDTTTRISEENWAHDSLFINHDYYTLLFDNEDDLEFVHQTDLSSVRFEWIQMEPRIIKRYYFEKKDKGWILEGIYVDDTPQNSKSDFLSFLYKFSNDSIYQINHIHQPLLFVTTDPDDDFLVIEATIDIDQWNAFKPVLSKDWLSNINYGQRNSSSSSTKILSMKGIGNGFSNTLYFKKTGGEWMLYKFEDISN